MQLCSRCGDTHVASQLSLRQEGFTSSRTDSLDYTVSSCLGGKESGQVVAAQAFNPRNGEVKTAGSCEFEANLVYRMGSRTVGATQRIPDLKNKYMKKKEKARLQILPLIV